MFHALGETRRLDVEDILTTLGNLRGRRKEGVLGQAGEAQVALCGQRLKPHSPHPAPFLRQPVLVVRAFGHARRAEALHVHIGAGEGHAA